MFYYVAFLAQSTQSLLSLGCLILASTSPTSTLLHVITNSPYMYMILHVGTFYSESLMKVKYLNLILFIPAKTLVYAFTFSSRENE